MTQRIGVLIGAQLEEIAMRALSNALDLDLIDTIRFMTNCDVDPVVTSREAIRNAINRHYDF